MLMPSIFGETLFDSFFDGSMNPVRLMKNAGTSANQMMKTDIKDTETGFELDIELPGYKKEDISAELKDGYLTVRASVDSEKEEKEDRFVRKERYFGSCSRSFRVNKDLTQEDITARFENGILKLFVPKVEVKPAIEEKKYILIEG